ncbi:MAG: hypothetical protein E7000_08710 [Coriobacteriaceae bacterium]|nr:hypothetical protein [Coriobacteriaceae bacterium]
MNEPLEDLYANLTDEQKQSVQSIGSVDELMRYARDEGFELSDEQLESIAGGSWYPEPRDSCVGYHCSELTSPDS